MLGTWLGFVNSTLHDSPGGTGSPDLILKCSQRSLTTIRVSAKTPPARWGVAASQTVPPPLQRCLGRHNADEAHPDGAASHGFSPHDFVVRRRLEQFANFAFLEFLWTITVSRKSPR
jgi:hypothetical protein